MLKDERGSALVIMCLALAVILGFSAFVIDYSVVYGQQRKLQNALNASALASCKRLPDKENAIESANKYFEVNGFDSSNLLVDFSPDTKIVTVTGTTDVNLAFSKLFGYTKTKVRLKSSASRAGLPPAFKYAVFSGSPTATLTFNGSNNKIVGGVHSNASFLSNGSKLNIVGGLEAVKSVRFNAGNSTVDVVREGVESIAMPDFSDVMRRVAQESGTYYSGTKTLNSSKVAVDESMFIDGDLIINGSNFTGRGTIVATGNITFNGSSVNGSSDDAVCFYSSGGNIIFNGAKAEIDGVAYAPEGSIIFNGSNQTITGRVVANRVLINGSGLTVTMDQDDSESIPYALYIKLVVPQ